jgi:ABC-2 type transport system ATP-binding protein
MAERFSVARAMVVAAIIVLAIASAPLLHLDYTPRAAVPELAVNLALAASTTDPVDMTNRWIVPIESAVRALGDVTEARTEVSINGAELRVRFKAGADVDVKAARLSSELVSLRAKLPEGSQLSVWPSTQARTPAMIVAMTGRRAEQIAQRVAGELWTASGVREVRVFGGIEREVEVNLARGIAPAVVRQSIERSMGGHAIGVATISARRLPLIVAPAAASIHDVRIPVGQTLAPIDSVASVAERRAEARAVARVNGQPAILMAIFRDDTTSLFTLERSVTSKLRGVQWESVWSEAGELRGFLRRAAIGLLLMIVALLFVEPVAPSGDRARPVLTAGTLAPALYVPVAIALMILVARLFDASVDVSTVIAALIAICGIAPFAAMRGVSERGIIWPAVIAAIFVSLAPIAVAFASGSLQPIFAMPARAFTIAALCAIGAAWIATVPSHRVRPPRGGARTVRRALHASASVVLALVAATCASFAWFGERLDPRLERSSDAAKLQIKVNLPSGTTLPQTIAAVDRVEKPLSRTREVERYWSFVSAGTATISLNISPAVRGEDMDLFRLRLGSMLPTGGGGVSVRNAGGGGASASDFEEKPFTDEQASVYRVLIRGTEGGAVERTAEQIVSRLSRIEVPRSAISIEGSAPATRIELVPRRDTSIDFARRVAQILSEQTLAPPSHGLPNGRQSRVVPFGAPRWETEVPPRVDVFSRPIDGVAIDHAFEIHDRFVSAGMQRDLGRFVLPVSIRVPGFGEEKINRRESIDRTVSLVPLDSGVTIERPSIAKWSVSAQKLRLFALIAFLPALLIAAAAMVLSSMPKAIGAVSICAGAVAFVAPILMLVSEVVNEWTLLAIGCAISCGSAMAVTMMVSASGEIASTYRTARRFMRPVIVAAIAGCAMLAVTAGAAPAIRDGWRAPLLAAAIVSLVSMISAAVVAPAIVIITRDVRLRRGAAARATRNPAAWREPGAPAVSVRNITKRYASGFRALRHVSFDLTPGVIGLLGPNGAGKTTLLRLMTGLLLPTRGQVLYRGVPVEPANLAEYRRLIGFLPQEFNAYAGLTAIDFIDYWALERGIDDAHERRMIAERLLANVGLEQDATRKVRDFSGGMRQRIGIARALIGDPPVLVVDEPTTGLDIESRNRFRDLIVSLARDRMIILSTHIAGDVEATASRILLLMRGELRWDGTPDALLQRANGRVFDVVVSEREARQLAREYRVTRRVRVSTGVRVRGVVPAEVPLPGPAATPVLEEAYLVEAAGDRSVKRSGFAFLFN